MPQQIYTVEIDGRLYDLEGDRAPTEAEARAAVAQQDATSTSTVSPVSPDEPGTYGGGVIKSLKTQGRDLAKAGLNALPGIGAIMGTVIGGAPTEGLGAVPGMALGAGVGRGARDLIGYATGLDAPTTPLEKAGAIGTDVALTGAIGAVAPGAWEAIKTPLRTTGEFAGQFGQAMPTWVRRLGNVIPSIPRSAAPIMERPAWQTWPESAIGGEAAASSPAAPIIGSLRMAADPAVPGFTSAEREALRRQYPAMGENAIARLEQQQFGAATPAPVAGTLRSLPQMAPATVPPAVTGGPARPTLTPDPASLAQLPPAAASGAPGGVPVASSALPPSAPSTIMEQLQASLQQGRPPAPVTGQVTPPPAEGPLQLPTADLADPMTQSRLGVGAERVARRTGKTIEQVREETGSLHGEELGTAADIFPKSAFDRLYAKMRAMKGVDQATRDALRTTYAESARDPKARAQLLTIMRGLNAEGLVIPIGVGVSAAMALRDRVRQRLAGEQ